MNWRALRQHRAARVLETVLLGALLAVLLWPTACRLPNFLIPDDGYFYARIALNLATLSRSTFDGIHTTSGYHLPWAFVLAAVARVVSLFTLKPEVHLLVFLALSFSIILATVREFFDSWLFRSCAFIVLLASFSLTEMVLAAPLMLGLLRGTGTPSGKGRHATELWLSPLLALVRVDLACVPLVLAILHLRTDRIRGLRLGATTLIGVGAQLATMKFMFGHFVSVAAILKTNNGLPDIPGRLAFNFGASSFQALFYAALFIFGAFAVAFRRDAATRAMVLAALSFLLLHTMLSIVRGWYWVPSSLGILFALERALKDRSAASGLVYPARLGVAFLALGFVVHSVRVEVFYAGDQRNAAAFLAELRQRIAAGTRLFTFDNPGYLGFFSGLRVVDGDGLVNDYTFARRLRARALEGYLDEEDICHVVVDYADAQPVMDVGGLVLAEQDVMRLAVHRRYRPLQADFVLIRLTAPRCQP